MTPSNFKKKEHQGVDYKWEIEGENHEEKNRDDVALTTKWDIEVNAQTPKQEATNVSLASLCHLCRRNRKKKWGVS